MTKTTIIYCCDICKKEVERKNLLQNVRLPFITYCDWKEGRACSEHIEFVTVDICKECLMKSTNLVCDFQGSYKRFKEKQNGTRD